MEKKPKIICDTDVIIEFLKGKQDLDKKFEEYGYDNLYLSSISIMELYSGAFNKKEIQKINMSLQELHILHISEEISAASVQLIEKYSKSHGLQLPDAIIAASALENKIPLFTFNRKDYRFIPGLQLVKS